MRCGVVGWAVSFPPLFLVSLASSVPLKTSPGCSSDLMEVLHDTSSLFCGSLQQAFTVAYLGPGIPPECRGIFGSSTASFKVFLDVRSLLEADPEFPSQSRSFETWYVECLTLVACQERNSSDRNWNILDVLRGRGFVWNHLVLVTTDGRNLEGYLKPKYKNVNATTIVLADEWTGEMNQVWHNFPNCRWWQRNWSDPFPSVRWNCSDIRLLSKSKTFAPFTFVKSRASDEREFVGRDDIMVDVINKYLKNINLSIHFEEGPWGTPLSNVLEASYGIVEDVLEGRIDATCGGWRGSALRFKYTSYLLTDFGSTFFLAPAAQTVPRDLSTLVLTFDYILWIWIVVTVIVVALVDFILHRCEGRPVSFTVEVLEVLRIFLQQSQVSSPRTNSTRLLTMVWWLATMILTVAYTSVVISELTIPRKNPPVDTFEELKTTPYVVLSRDYAGGKKYYSEDIRHFLAMSESLRAIEREGRIVFVDSAVEALRLVSKEQAVFVDIMDHVTMFTGAKGLSQFHVMDSTRAIALLGCLTRRGMFGLDQITDLVFAINSCGLNRHWKDAASYLADHPPESRVDSEFSPLFSARGRLLDLLPLLQATACGLLLATMVFVAELVVHNCRKHRLVARLEGQLGRTRSAAETAEKNEEELRQEKRKLQRELKDAQERIEELETSNSHLQKRFDKLKNARSTLLKELSESSPGPE
ncbi:unnamed protein product [Cyprideis torosa]|uniref:Ionotropic glutamate receptor C-terminal domain-containing protein n=1 Tax=Cyprideis torosa TaxID=163714 RepID=A0A7R8WLP4_9CRUS|nr:unnamed protein product [Cyprideis torosa]CAG0904560.1 unnamed protein product [Cyprideis torosa]